MNIVYRVSKHPDLSNEAAQLFVKTRDSEKHRESEIKRVRDMIV
jgi:hypothetical protein